jgi:4a-hydroxytetrahydrobiopterin dehydratase
MTDPTPDSTVGGPAGAARLGNADIDAAGLADWRKLAQALHARFAVRDYVTGAAFVTAVAGEADAAGHRPDVRLTAGAVFVSLCTHEDGRWVTDRDVALARTISEIAARLGLEPLPSAVSQVELALDTASDDEVAPFWSALLTGTPENRIYDSVFDPTDRVPSLWFQITDNDDPARQRWHLDVWVAPEEVEARIAAAVAAGGTVVDDSTAPSFTVLADRDGNRVCVCAQTGRE